MQTKLLLLSNGHGEDAIAVKIGQAWAQLTGLTPAEGLAALPMVGEGNAYHRLGIPLITPGQTLPSGGFNNMDVRQLWRDLRGGLLGLTKTQWDSLQKWAHQGGKVLAVGDLVPLALAWLSQCDYGFVGTAKSEYYLRQPGGEWLPSTQPWEKWLGSAYYPWERWFMTRARCVGVFPRDRLTHGVLQGQGIASYDVGNPMMDGLATTAYRPQPLGEGEDLIITLLPGSRSPEIGQNWVLILESLRSVSRSFPGRKLTFLAAIAPSLSLPPLIRASEQEKWQAGSHHGLDYLTDGQTFTQDNAQLIFSQRGFNHCLHYSRAAIAMAGTATEQFVGMGKPVVSFPGPGPQYNAYFARRQTWLLGISLTLVDRPAQVGNALKNILENGQQLLAIADNGRARLGPGGAAEGIAKILSEKWG